MVKKSTLKGNLDQQRYDKNSQILLWFDYFLKYYANNN